MHFTPFKTSVITCAGMAAGLLLCAYFVPAVEGEESLKDVILLVSGGLLSLAGMLATDNPPNHVQAILDWLKETGFRSGDRDVQE